MPESCALTNSCNNFNKIDWLVIKMVNEHYFDLQMYANFVFDIDNNEEEISNDNNFYMQIRKAQKEYDPKYPSMPLFTKNRMEKLSTLVINMLDALKDNKISADKYLSDINKIEFFGSGAASSTVLLKIYRRVGNNMVTPLIIKLIPFQLPHQYKYLPSVGKNTKFIWEYIESPSYALFIKEAWMYCFSKNELLKYTPTFTCVANCYIIEGFPIKNVGDLIDIYDTYAQKRIASGKKLPYKKWFNILTDPDADPSLRQSIMDAEYGCFEMAQIEGTLDDLYDKKGAFNLSIIFEYLYTKVVAAFIGRVIFTDDHLGNVAYVTVDYARAYNIKCNGCEYVFYMSSSKMVQFIDLERYVFNYSRYDIYTNTALSSIRNKDFDAPTENLNRIRHEYAKNNYIFDKTLSSLLEKSFGEKNFENPNNPDEPNEYVIMLQILTSHFIHDIKTFCQIMEANLPQKYLVKPTDKQIVKYYLNLDDNSIRVITFEDLNEQIG